MSVRPALVAALLAPLASCHSTGKSVAASFHVLALDEYDVNNTTDDGVSGLGVEAHLLQLGPDVSVGYEQREISGEDVEEVFFGGRFFLVESPVISPYLSARLRYSPDGVDVPDSDSYTGYALGAGSFVWFVGPTYIDVNVHYEDLLSDPAVGGTETGFDGVVVEIGIGVAF